MNGTLNLSKLDPAEAVLDLKVLDPAMGSGHFLVTAVDFLSDYIAELIEYVPAVPEWLDDGYVSPLVGRVATIRREIIRRARESNWVLDKDQLTDQAIIRRMVLKRCIYGVDKNPLTVELAKVSLWLHSFTVGAPLSFLDHHLRCGDSLVGLRVSASIKDLQRIAHLFLGSAIQGAETATKGMQRIEEMSDADVAEVRESAALFHDVEETTADLRGLLDFLCGWRWLTAGMKKKERAAFEGPLVTTLGRQSVEGCLPASGPRGPAHHGRRGSRFRLPPPGRSSAELLARGANHCQSGRLPALGGGLSGGVAASGKTAARKAASTRSSATRRGTASSCRRWSGLPPAPPNSLSRPRRLRGEQAFSGCATKERPLRPSSTRPRHALTNSANWFAHLSTIPCWAVATLTCTRCSLSGP